MTTSAANRTCQIDTITNATTRSVQPAHHGPGRHPERLGRLGVGQAGDVDQFDHSPEGLVERGERPFDLGVEPHIDRAVGDVDGCGVAQLTRRAVGLAEQFGSTAEVAVDVGVAQDRQQPGSRMPAVEALTDVMRIDHLRYGRYLDALVDGELDGGLRSRVADHVAACPMCGRDAVSTVRVKHSLARHRVLEECATPRRPS
jgi:hypothetical protein